MAAERLVCAIVGHRWNWRGNDAPYSCSRCKQLDEDPKVVRAARRRQTIKRWSPVWFTISRKDLTIRIGYYRPISLQADVRLHYGWDRTSELPGLNVSLTLWRLRLWAGLGNGWQDEDGDSRSLTGFNASFQTYGLRYVGCWLGHKPKASDYLPGNVYCERCDEELVRVDHDAQKVAA